MRLIGRVCVSEAAGLGQSRGSSCLPAACTGNRVCHFLGSTLDHDGGGGECLSIGGYKKQNWNISWPSICQVVLHYKSRIPSRIFRHWSGKFKRKFVSTWIFLTRDTDDCIMRHKAWINMRVRTADSSLFDLDWGSALWSDETKFQFLSPSLSLLFMDGLSFRLMCKPDSYQSSCRNPASVMVSERLKCLQNWIFHPCDGTSDAKRYKPVKGQCWSTGSEAEDMFQVGIISAKLCTTIKMLHLYLCEGIENYQFNLVIRAWWASFSERKLNLAERTWRVIKHIFKDKLAHCCPYLLQTRADSRER